MTEFEYGTLDQTHAVLLRDFPETRPPPALSTFLGEEVRLDAASKTVIQIFDSSDRDSGVYVETLPAEDTATDIGIADRFADALAHRDRSPQATEELCAASTELADVQLGASPTPEERAVLTTRCSLGSCSTSSSTSKPSWRQSTHC